MRIDWDLYVFRSKSLSLLVIDGRHTFTVVERRHYGLDLYPRPGNNPRKSQRGVYSNPQLPSRTIAYPILRPISW